MRYSTELAKIVMKYANEAIMPPHMHTDLQPNLLVSAETMGPEGEKNRQQ